MVSATPFRRRRAATTVEAAFVYPVMFFLLFGLIVGGLGVFRYQTVACQASGLSSPSQPARVSSSVPPSSVSLPESPVRWS